MVKKIGVFITILGLFFLGIPQFNSNALIYNGVDYRILETGTPIELSGYQYNPVVINEPNGGATISNWLNYMQINGIHRVEMQGSNVSTFYFYFGTNEIQIAHNVFKVELGFDTGFAYFYMRLYGLNQVMLEEVVLAYSETQWELPSDTRVLTNVNFQSADNVYSQGYNNGYNDATDELWAPRYELGYNTALEQYGFYDWVNDTWLTAQEYGEIKYNNGYLGGRLEGYHEGLNETDATGFTALLTTVFGGLGTLLAIEILPNIHIGAIIAVPLVFGIIFFILGKRKGD